jgi:single-strand DNA-binding protein
MSDVNVTVIGHVGTEPSLSTSPNGVEWTTFRVASTRRVRDPRTGEWGDGETLWFTVKAFRDKARNIGMSVRKGDPVVVAGRLALEEWDGQREHTLADGSTVTLPERRYRQVIEAQHVGVDATRGVVRFARVVDRADVPGGAGGAAGSTTAPGSMIAAGGAGVEDPWQTEVPVRVPDDASALGAQVAGLEDEHVEDEQEEAEAVTA